MDETRKSGRVTIPTDLDVVPETLEILKKWGADAIRDCDGTDFPQQLKDADAKIYSTYYTTRKDNAWAKANPDEVQQCYIMTGFYTAPGDTVTIPLMKGISPELMQVNTNDDITRWWEVMDRTTGQPVPPERWSYADGSVTVQAVPFHEYTVSFLAYLIWDPVHMYDATTNGWTNFEHQITFDVRQPKTHKYSMERLRKFIAEHPYVNVIRYTTFFHQFTLIFDELKREKFVDWYGYSASVSPYILNQFEQEVGYKFRPEYIIDQGYYNNQYRVPSKEFRDFQAFQRREVAKLAKEMVDITHACGCEAMMFLGDHWIGTEPFMPEFKTIGLDAVVGSVGNGSTLRLISDIEGVKYAKVKVVRDENGLATGFETEGDFPKYGNDDDRADEIGVWLLRTFLEMIKKRHTYRNSEATTSILTITSNVVYGKYTGALPDGRAAFTPFAPGATPSYGAEQNGLLASLNSVAKLPYHWALDGISNTQTINPEALGHSEGERVENLVQIGRASCRERV